MPKYPGISLSLSADLTVSALDSLFNLAAHTLDVSDVATCEKSLAYLRQASELVRLVDEDRSRRYGNMKTIDENQADYLRCISGAYFNIACTLYGACKFGAAARFLNEANPIADQALQSHKATKASNEAPKTNTAWRHLKLQLYKRWELLAVCYTKTNDRRVSSATVILINFSLRNHVIARP